MKKSLSLLFIIVFYVTAGYGQSTQVEIDRLQQLVKMNEQMALKNAERARKAEAELRVMRYLAIATELAEQSIEIPEKEIAALMAVQAYNINVQYSGVSFNNKLYNSLFDAMKRNDLLAKNASSDAEEKYFLMNSKPIFSAMLPDSSASVVAEQNGNLKFVTKQGLTVRTLSGHRAQVNQIVFSHSGKLMATSGKDNTIRIWNLNQLNVRPLVISESDQINKLMFSVDDSYIFYTQGVKKVIINQRPLDLKLMAEELCNTLTRNFTADEWRTYVATDLPYEQTCSKYPPNNN
jgi:hypothetical protein